MRRIWNWLRDDGWFVIISVVLLLLVIWLLGPSIRFGDSAPLGTRSQQIIATIIVLMGVALTYLVRFLYLRRNDLFDRQTPASSAALEPASHPHAEARMRERFRQAISIIRSEYPGKFKPYTIPWYVLIGPVASGKTALIANSGLKFSLSGKFGRPAIFGDGANETCDWWLTPDALILDTVGKLTVNEANGDADSRSWKTLLEELRRYRPHQPISGLLLTLSVPDLLKLSAEQRHQLALTIRLRLLEIHDTLKICVPVYVIVTKLDVLSGFAEYFFDLAQEQRSQVWGYTLPLNIGDERALKTHIATEHDALVERLHRIALVRMESERDRERRAQIFAFPDQFASLSDPLAEFVDEVFAFHQRDRRCFLRGVYYGSSTRDGTRADRLVEWFQHTFRVELLTPGRRIKDSRPLFIESMFRNVIFKESNLAGPNERDGRRARLIRRAASVGVVMLAGCISGWMLLSYVGNRDYLRGIGDRVPAVLKIGPAERMNEHERIVASVLQWDALNGLGSVADPYTGHPPLSLRAGLEQSEEVSAHVRDARLRLINTEIVPLVARRIAVQLTTPSVSPERLYAYLKAYLMLIEPSRADIESLRPIMRGETAALADGDVAVAGALSGAVDELLESQPLQLRPVQADTRAISAARSTIRQASVAWVVLATLRYSGTVEEHQRRAEPMTLLVPGITSLFSRRSGKGFDQPLDWLFTREGFRYVTKQGAASAVTMLSKEPWVLGEGMISPKDVLLVRRKTLELYESNYRAYWQDLIGDLELRSGPDKLSVLPILSGTNSPLKGFLRLVAESTNLTAGADTEESIMAEAAANTIANRMSLPTATLSRMAEVARPGVSTANQFAPYRSLVSGGEGATPVDQLIKALSEYQYLRSQNALSSPDPANVHRLDELVANVRGVVESWPLVPRQWVLGLVTGTQANELKTAQRQWAAQVTSTVSVNCQSSVGQRYPFSRYAKTDMPMQDFAKLFGGGGEFDAYFAQHLAESVEVNPFGWRWKSQVRTPPATTAQLAMFQHAAEIRDAFFQSRSAQVKLSLDISLATHTNNVRKVVLRSAGSQIDVPVDARMPTRFEWPDGGAGYIALQMVLENGVTVPLASASGDWALFRVLDAASQTVPRGERGAEYRYSREGSQIGLMITSSAPQNPLSRRIFDNFHCVD